MPERVGPWILEHALGAGGMGAVYAGIHSETGATGAIKLVHDAVLHASALRREISVLERLAHPGIVRFLGHGLEGDTLWYAMERLDGRTVATGIASSTAGRASHHTFAFDDAPDGPVDEPSKTDGQGTGTRDLGWVVDLCHVLAWLHGEGIVHRDLKPENVVRRGASCVLVDFGLAGSVKGDLSTRMGSRTGTPAYVAPEQIQGKRVDPRADLYSLGCLLFEVFTGQPPFTGSVGQVVQGHLHATAPRLSEVWWDAPPELDDLLAELLEKRPADRTPHADRVARILATAFGLRPERPDDWPAPRPYLYSPRLHERKDALGAAVAGIERTVSVRVVGPSGSGRSAFLAELPAWLHHRPIRAASADAGPLLDQLVDTTDLPEPEPGLAVADRIAWAVAHALRQLPPATVVLVDDEDRLDASGTQTLDVLRTLGAAQGLRFITTAATGDADVRLEPLSVHGVEDLVADCLGEARTPAPIRDTVAEHSGGYPLLATLFLEQALQSGLLRKDSRHRWSLEAGRRDLLGSQAGSAHDLIDSHLSGLDAHSRAVLDVVAVLGRAADDARIDALVDFEARPVVHALVRRGLLRDESDGVRLRGSPWRDALRAALSDAERTRLHGAAADLLAGQQASPLDVGRHLARAGRSQDAARVLLEAQGVDREAALSAWLELDDRPDAARLAVLEELTNLYLSDIRLSDARTTAEPALALARGLKDAPALCRLGVGLAGANQNHDAAAGLAALQEAETAATTDAERALVHAQRGYLHRSLGDTEAALADWARARDNLPEARRVMVDVAAANLMLVTQGEDKREAALTAAVAFLQQAGQPVRALRASLQLPLLWAGRGEIRRSVDANREQLRDAIRAGQRRIADFIRNNLAFYHSRRGEVREARELLVDIDFDGANPGFEYIARLNLARVYVAENDIDAAHHHFERIQARDAPHPILGDLVEIEARQLVLRRDGIHAAIHGLSEPSGSGPNAVLARAGFARLLRLAGRREEAERVIRAVPPSSEWYEDAMRRAELSRYDRVEESELLSRALAEGFLRHSDLIRRLKHED